MKVLITGGAGFIGTHISVELLEKDYDLVIYDNLSNSSKEGMKRVEEITGKSLKFYEGDILDKAFLKKVLIDEKIDLIIHCASLKAVGESVEKPLEYYHNNVTGSIILLEAMREAGVKNIIFSSSATVYGDPKVMPITEDAPKGEPTNPYGWSKSMIEQIMVDNTKADPDLKVVLLRYFNPIGAHPSGLIGEDPRGIPNNLVPYVAMVSTGRLEKLSVYGDDYDTPDGTGVRDYIHVVDLAKGHVAAVEKLDDLKQIEIINLGTGEGYSVLDVIKAYEKASGAKVPYEIVGRRSGDVATSYADPAKAKKVLGWEAKYDLEDMCRDSYKFQKNNPEGYGG